MTAGPAKAMTARETKLAIMLMSIPMASLRRSNKLSTSGYESTRLLWQFDALLCDALSQQER
ncbi:MAG: Uncharacterised protein [Prochlorococcus marinus str. MIT 9215]|nr:MAG: Uncharacterised protein [Prochlorococcus marinus str. MIT 9215]